VGGRHRRLRRPLPGAGDRRPGPGPRRRRSGRGRSRRATGRARPGPASGRPQRTPGARRPPGLLPARRRPARRPRLRPPTRRRTLPARPGLRRERPAGSGRRRSRDDHDQGSRVGVRDGAARAGGRPAAPDRRGAVRAPRTARARALLARGPDHRPRPGRFPGRRRSLPPLPGRPRLGRSRRRGPRAPGRDPGQRRSAAPGHPPLRRGPRGGRRRAAVGAGARAASGGRPRVAAAAPGPDPAGLGRAHPRRLRMGGGALARRPRRRRRPLARGRRRRTPETIPGPLRRSRDRRRRRRGAGSGLPPGADRRGAPRALAPALGPFSGRDGRSGRRRGPGCGGRRRRRLSSPIASGCAPGRESAGRRRGSRTPVAGLPGPSARRRPEARDGTGRTGPARRRGRRSGDGRPHDPVRTIPRPVRELRDGGLLGTDAPRRSAIAAVAVRRGRIAGRRPRRRSRRAAGPDGGHGTPGHRPGRLGRLP